jgi:serine phosphatase RsbU (regulator of sigma subunit)
MTHGDALFATLFAGILDPTKGTLTFVNAGHNPPLIIQNGKQHWIKPTGPAVGMLEGQSYKAEKIILEPGDRLFVYSDGLEDVKNGQDEFYSRNRLEDSFFEKNSSIETIIGQIDAFMSDELQYDDLTLLVVNREHTA